VDPLINSVIMKINSLYICVFIFVCISCSEKVDKSKDFKKVQSPVVLNGSNKQKEKDCLKLGDTILLKQFLLKIKKTCKEDSTGVNDYFTENVKKNYLLNFCSLLEDAYSNKEGEVSYRVIVNSDECKGVIEIYSIDYYLDENGEKYRNEYSTHFYIIKKNHNLVIDEIGGVG